MARRRRSERGAIAVEFALIVPVLLLIVFGIVDFGYMINRDMLVDNTVRDGARVASLGGSFSDVCTAVKSELTNSGLPTPSTCNSGASPTAAAPTTVTIDCIKTDNSPCGATSSTYDTLAVSGATATISISYRYTWITPLMSSFLGNYKTLNENAQMVVE